MLCRPLSRLSRTKAMTMPPRRKKRVVVRMIVAFGLQR
jgi:hypothetical protein